MSTVTVYQEPDTIRVSKQTESRLGRVINIFPASICLTESTYLSGVFDEWNPAGIPVPDAAAVFSDGGAGVMSGDRAGYVVFRDGNRDSVGNPSPISNTLTITNKQITVTLTGITNEYDSTRVTHMDIYVNLSTGGSIYYFAATVAIGTTSTTINLSDASLQANDTLELDNDAPDSETYGAVVGHKGYHFLIGAHSNVTSEYEDDFTWSKIANADQFPLLNRTKVEPGRYGRLHIAVPCGDALIFYKESAIYELHFDQHPSGIFGDGFAKTVNTMRGTVNKRTVANVQGTHFVMDRTGIYVFSGGTAYREIGTKLRKYWDDINWSRKEWFTAVVDRDRVIFWVALGSETECRFAFVLDLNAWYAQSEANWYLHETAQGIRDACSWTIGDTATGAAFNGLEYTPVVSVITEYGFTGYLSAGYRDFMDPMLTAQGTATGGTTTTLVDSGATWSRTTDFSRTVDPTGASVRFILPNADKPGSDDWDRDYRITGVSGTTITFTPAAPAAIASGMTYVIGCIPNVEMRTPVYGFGQPHKRKRAANIIAEFQPAAITTNNKLNLQVLMDRRFASLSRLTKTSAQKNSTDRYPGVDMNLGGDAKDGGRQGCHAEPLGGRGFSNLQVVITGNIYGGHAIDNASVLDAIMIDDLQTENEVSP